VIKLKLSFGPEKPAQDFDIVYGELLSEAVSRALTDVPLNGRQAGDVFLAVVNGHTIEPDLWKFTKLRTEDTVLITPNIKDGDSGSLFKQAAIIAVAVVASVYLGPAVTAAYGSQIYGALAVAGATFGASLLLNSLIPPPVPNMGDLSFGGGGLNESQMYSVSGQTNQIKRFGTVPKVYGVHRIFPPVAAIPYTELDVDQETGEQIQYLYAIYDFGLGSMNVTDIKIGDTPLSDENFQDFTVRWVDFNRPSTPTNDFEIQTNTDLALYRGDFEGSSIGAALNGNQEDGDIEANYLAIRNTAPNTDGSGQEIIVNLVNPQGLYAINTSGSRTDRRISLDISFAPVGTEDWQKYNDPVYVDNFRSTGATSDQFDFPAKLALSTPSTPETDPYYRASIYPEIQVPDNTRWVLALFPTGDKILVETDVDVVVGSAIFFRGTQFVGKVVSFTTFSPGVLEITMDRNFDDNGLGEAFLYYGFTTGLFSYLTPPTTWINASYGGNWFVRIHKHSLGRADIVRNSLNPVYSSIRFTPKTQGQFKIRVIRVSSDSTFSSSFSDALTWVNLTTRFDRSPIITDKRHLFMELKIRATSQLNGSISDLSGVASSVLDVYDPDTQTWSPQITSNPAWVFCDLLTGEVNKKAVDKSRLDMDSIVEWAEFCDEIPDSPPSYTYISPRFTTNFVLDFQTTLSQIANQVSGAAQASLNIVDGKYGVLIDRRRTTPVQIFTPRNCRDFSSVRVYTQRPHALKVSFINPDLNWEVDQVVVYDDGYDETTATDIEEMSSFAATNRDQAFRFGRYLIAQNKLRQETISITVDFENLVCTRGDFVQITQDVMRVGGSPARVKSIAGTIVTLDDSFDIDPMLNYGYTFRASDGQIKTSTLTSVAPNEFDLEGDLPQAGDLIIIGEVGNITFDCVVKAISPNDDMSANISLIEKADAIYDYESTATLPDYDPQISQTSGGALNPPNEVENLEVVDSTYTCNATSTGYRYFVDLAWDAPIGSVYELFSINVKVGSVYNEVATTRKTVYRYEVDINDVDFEHSFKVIAVSATGNKLPLGSVGSVEVTPVSKTTPPSDVTSLHSDITNEVIQLSWPQIPDCDVKEYRIKYTPDLEGTWGAANQLVRVDKNVNLVSAQARTGTYLIKAVDFGGRESAGAATIITTIPSLFGLNVVDTIDDSPTWDGAYDRTDLADGVVLAIETPGPVGTRTFYAEGYYYYQTVVDLTDVYTVRLQSLIQADALADGDLMIDWLTLSSVTALDSVVSSDWLVETQYRATNVSNSIDGWASLDIITALNEGDAAIYTPWRTFVMGDATGRVFQFRLKLTTNALAITPRVYEGDIRIDMPDRIESYENLTANDTTGYTVTYDYAFAGPAPSPNVQVTIDDASTGDYWVFESKNLTGFTIKFFDNTDTQVERTFDAVIKGYGRKQSVAI
jgi:Putative phage tail protein